MMYGIGMYRVMHACLNIHTTGTGEFWIKDREDLFMTTRNLKRGCGSRDRTHGLAWRCPIVRISSVRSEVTLLLKHRLMEETSALGPLAGTSHHSSSMSTTSRGPSALSSEKSRCGGHGSSLTAPPRVARMLGGPFDWRRPSYSRMRQKTFPADEVDPLMPLKGRSAAFDASSATPS